VLSIVYEYNVFNANAGLNAGENVDFLHTSSH